MMLTLLFALFFVLLFMGMPVAYCMVISSVITLFFDPSLAGIVIPQKLFTGMDSFGLMAVPFFMLAGTLMEKSGITNLLVDWARSLVGHLRGGLGSATVVTGVVMAGVSGSANADTSALASILVPIMRKDGYDDGHSCALVASCGGLGVIIPPSILMVLYSGVTSIAIGSLFIAGIVPGLMIAGGYLIINYIYARRANIPLSKFVGFKTLARDTLTALPALFMPAIIIGGILSGVTTATEAGVIACFYSVIYGLLRKTMNLKKVFESFREAVHGTTNCMIVVVFSGIFGMLATNYNLSKVVLALAEMFHGNQYIILIFMCIILYIAGMFVDTNAVMLMFVPIFLPLIGAYGFDSIHFAMVCILALEMGGLSPPVGLLMYISASVTETPLANVVKNIFKFLAVNWAVLLLVIFVPAIVTWLPSLM